jgi:hypothetical protein
MANGERQLWVADATRVRGETEQDQELTLATDSGHGKRKGRSLPERP